MNLILQRISVISSDTYELEFVGAQRKLVACSVIHHRGIRVVRPNPDIFATAQVDARRIANAVLAFHDAREATVTS